MRGSGSTSSSSSRSSRRGLGSTDDTPSQLSHKTNTYIHHEDDGSISNDSSNDDLPVAAIAAAAAAPGSPTDRDSSSSSSIDLSFSLMGPAGLRALLDNPKPTLDGEELRGSVVDAENIEIGQNGYAWLSPVHGLGLRECLLGDAGVVEIARSPWVCGPKGSKVLSLRHNQV